MNSRILRCACGVTVIEDPDGTRASWLTARPHDCSTDRLGLIDALAEDALAGDPDSSRLLAEALDGWLCGWT